MTIITTTEAGDFTWLIADFVRRVHGVADAVAVSSDGLLLAGSEALDRDAADHLSAVVSGITSLAHSAAHAHVRMGGGVKLVMVEMYGGFLLVSTVRDGSCLGVLAEADSDVGMIGYEMGVLADQAGALLTPRLVTELQAAVSGGR
ncbi:dynein regulation protein LC7 [Streptomyces sp. A7024]|uniref:Dynein regulation protein LC7 n=1 Tax=Streptomyces coryli TaxID=1128680 RepID=A0A6G4UEW0_9ACTN|nr:roadblock/LC7 domain-containing protein [Streptomyces coryli]NGN70268.1 dynein regulation protein LC7 [Streptomyces coryli]